jgi:tetratricopeptide (TPR) repeat protein
VLGEDHKQFGESLESMGGIYAEQGKYHEAVEMYEEALAVYTRALGIDNEKNAEVLCNMAKHKALSGDVSGALESARESVRIYTKLGIDNQDSQQASERLLLLYTLKV